MWFRLQKNARQPYSEKLAHFWGAITQTGDYLFRKCNLKVRIRFLSPYIDYYVGILRVNPLNQCNTGKIMVTCLKLESFSNYARVL